MDPNVYLAEGFDISKLTIPNLRSILVEHQVHFPSNASKGDLIEFFSQHVKPKSASILRKYNVGAPDSLSDTGILDMRSNTNSNSPVTEPLPLSDDDKTIPSKRHSESAAKRTKKKVRKNHDNSSFSDSNSDSFLAIEKFEINESDNIFQRGSVDGVPLNILKKTKYAAKKPKLDTKNLLSKFDNSLPLSKNFKSDKSFSESNSNLNSKSSSSPLGKSEDVLSNISTNNDLNGNNDVQSEIDSNSLHNTLVENENLTNHENLFNYESSEIILINENEQAEKETIKQLSGPTKNIKDSIIIANSDHEEEIDDEEVVLEKSIVEEKLVSKIDVKSLASFESEGISFSNDSIDVDSESIDFQKPIEELVELPLGKDVKERVEEKAEKIAEEIKGNSLKHEAKDEDNTIYSIENDEIIDKSIHKKSNGWSFSRLYNVVYTMFIIVNVLVPLLLILSFREIQYNVGYCGFGNQSKPLNIWNKIPNSLNYKLLPIKPYVENVETLIVNLAQIECQKCPAHGSCTSRKLTCDPYYIKKTPISSYFGLIPLQEYCDFDSVREEKMRYLFDYTLSYLHRHNVKPLTIDELYDYLKSTKPSNIKSEEFEDYWNHFVEVELSKNDENSMFEFNYDTAQITLSHRTPTEYYTKTFGPERNKKSQNLFKKTPPTVDLKNYYTRTNNE